MSSIDAGKQLAVLVRVAEAETFGGDPGGVILLLADAASTGGRLNSHRLTFRQVGDDVPPHYHARSKESRVARWPICGVIRSDSIYNDEYWKNWSRIQPTSRTATK